MPDRSTRKAASETEQGHTEVRGPGARRAGTGSGVLPLAEPCRPALAAWPLEAQQWAQALLRWVAGRLARPGVGPARDPGSSQRSGAPLSAPGERLLWAVGSVPLALRSAWLDRTSPVPIVMWGKETQLFSQVVASHACALPGHLGGRSGRQREGTCPGQQGWTACSHRRAQDPPVRPEARWCPGRGRGRSGLQQSGGAGSALTAAGRGGSVAETVFGVGRGPAAGDT